MTSEVAVRVENSSPTFLSANRRAVAVFAGIRSQYMKLASLQKAYFQSSDLSLIFIDTGQHYDDVLAKQYIEEYQIHFDYSLNCGDKTMSSTEVFARMIVECENILRKIEPSAAIVFGDANSTLSAALAARRLTIPLIHVEAGLRTNSSTSEELNRVIVDRISQLHIASTKKDYARLVHEGYEATSEYLGDLVKDLAANYTTQNLDKKENKVLVSIHRDENTRNCNLILSILGELLDSNFFIHLITHPKVAKRKEFQNAHILKHEKVTVTPSLPHHKLLKLMWKCKFCVTDSGALQREGFYVGTRSIVIQESPFWPTLTDAKYNIKVNPGDCFKSKISEIEKPFDGYIDDFGSGNVAEEILNFVNLWVNKNVES
ncbi:UDP-N-acetylglucosamine 2-epimerase [Thalassomonas sp. RHCl1]|uniref:UDP-N-acetylglucosamine 2-epimerase n=1 Tax=Thalassomonas sp. RHCl1 TaxID=2995320 RepID=UPI00248B87AB|nr:UDP-N-acetylglucosamine 2-epimerase [Thalassomonas sp. RHCl1]